ncbi:hypothetical protein BBP40_002754 [Aspergillus hancockii]|nr:hypothetical protein BBP40_002754 [Aspergillus hancockii]
MRIISKAAASFVPLGAAATLIGSSTAESLTLGNRGTAGLPWATLTFFGVLSVIKTCIAAACPDCFRDAIGVRSPEVDSALGMSIGLRVKPTHTGSAGPAVGVAGDSSENPSGGIKFGTNRVTYTFDQHTLDCLKSVPELEPKADLEVYTYSNDPWSRDRFKRSLWTDGLALAMSLVKITEMIVLLRQGASHLYWVTGSTWAYFFVGALILQILRLFTNFPSDNDHRPKVDILAGELPSLYTAGGKRRVLLGVPKLFRSHDAWKALWLIGAVVTLASVVGAWSLLEKQSSPVIYTWVGFQLVWLAARSLFFYVSGGKEDTSRHPLIIHKKWQHLNSDSKARVRNLVFALSKYEMFFHSRGFHSYQEDTVAITAWNGFQQNYDIGIPARGTQVDIDITEVIGDTLLYNACWVLGSKLSVMDLHDSCIVRLRQRGDTVTVPAVRVLSELVHPENNEEGIEKLYPPRGGTNTGINIRWWYWIPCG